MMYKNGYSPRGGGMQRPQPQAPGRGGNLLAQAAKKRANGAPPTPQTATAPRAPQPKPAQPRRQQPAQPRPQAHPRQAAAQQLRNSTQGFQPQPQAQSPAQPPPTMPSFGQQPQPGTGFGPPQTQPQPQQNLGWQTPHQQPQYQAPVIADQFSGGPPETPDDPGSPQNPNPDAGTAVPLPGAGSNYGYGSDPNSYSGPGPDSDPAGDGSDSDPLAPWKFDLPVDIDILGAADPTDEPDSPFYGWNNPQNIDLINFLDALAGGQPGDGETSDIDDGPDPHDHDANPHETDDDTTKTDAEWALHEALTGTGDYGLTDEALAGQEDMVTKAAAQAKANLSQQMGARGFGASGLVGSGFGAVDSQAQAQVNDIHFKNEQLAIEERLNELKTVASLYGHMLSEEQKMAIFEEMHDLEQDKFGHQQDQDEKSNDWNALLNAFIMSQQGLKGSALQNLLPDGTVIDTSSWGANEDGTPKSVGISGDFEDDDDTIPEGDPQEDAGPNDGYNDEDGNWVPPKEHPSQPPHYPGGKYWAELSKEQQHAYWELNTAYNPDTGLYAKSPPNAPYDDKEWAALGPEFQHILWVTYANTPEA